MIYAHTPPLRSHPLSRPLQFGCREQIDLLRTRARRWAEDEERFKETRYARRFLFTLDDLDDDYPQRSVWAHSLGEALDDVGWADDYDEGIVSVAVVEDPNPIVPIWEEVTA